MTTKQGGMMWPWLIGFGCGVVWIFLASIHAQELIILTTPESVATLTGFRIERLITEPNNPDTPSDEGRLIIQLAGGGRPVALMWEYHARTTPTGTFLITALNKANLSTVYAGNATTGSLKQRVHHRLVVMGEAAQVCGRAITGSLSGSPP